MYHGRDTGAYELPEDELSAFIAARTEMMRAGNSTPININLEDGKVLRFSCTALPDGGRMLSYTPVTDLVRHTDDPAQCRLLPVAARRRTSPPARAVTRRGIAAAHASRKPPGRWTIPDVIGA